MKRIKRRTKALRLDWSQMPEHLKAIYDRRSRDLHDGIPFPLPMCQPPYRSAGDIASEISDFPPAAAWTFADAPMLLQTFEYIVRNTLHACRYLRRRGIGPRIARRGIESSERFYAPAMLACAVACFSALQRPPW